MKCPIFGYLPRDGDFDVEGDAGFKEQGFQALEQACVG